MAKGNGGAYDYFFCRGRQEGVCDVPHIPVEVVEQAVVDHYQTITFEPALIQDLRRNIHATLADSQESIRLERNQLQNQLNRLEVAESNLIDLDTEGSLPNNKIRERLHDNQVQRIRITEQLDQIQTDLGEAAELLDTAIEFLSDPGHLYNRVTNKDRRKINQAVFDKLYIDDDTVTHDEPHEPFAELITLQRNPQRPTTRNPTKTQNGRPPADTQTGAGTPKSNAALLAAALQKDLGSSNTTMVDRTRLELVTSRV